MEIASVERITVHLFIGHQADVRHVQQANLTLSMMSVWLLVLQLWLFQDLSVSVTQPLTIIKPDICAFHVHLSILTVLHVLMKRLILKEIVRLVQQGLSQLIREAVQLLDVQLSITVLLLTLPIVQFVMHVLLDLDGMQPQKLASYVTPSMLHVLLVPMHLFVQLVQEG